MVVKKINPGAKKETPTGITNFSEQEKNLSNQKPNRKNIAVDAGITTRDIEKAGGVSNIANKPTQKAPELQKIQTKLPESYTTPIKKQQQPPQQLSQPTTDIFDVQGNQYKEGQEFKSPTTGVSYQVRNIGGKLQPVNIGVGGTQKDNLQGGPTDINTRTEKEKPRMPKIIPPAQRPEKTLPSKPIVEGKTTTPADQTTTDQKKLAFEQQAQQEQAKNQQFLDQRNNELAKSIISGIETFVKGGGIIDNTTKEQIIQDTISNYGGKVDMNNPDWINTINEINKKIQSGFSKYGVNNWDDFYKRVNKKFPNLNKYSNNDSMFRAYKDGKINQQQLDNLKITDPNKYNSFMTFKGNKETLNSITEYGNSIYNAMGGKEAEDNKIERQDYLDDDGNDENTNMTNMVENYMKEFTNTPTVDRVDLMKTYNDYMDTDEVKTAQTDLLSAKSNYKDIVKTINNIGNDVRNQYKGTGTTESFIRAEINKRTMDLQNELDDKRLDYEDATDAYNMIISDAKEKFNINLQQLSIDKQDQAQRRSESFQMMSFMYGISQDELARKDKYNMLTIQEQMQLNAEDRSWNNWLKQTEITNYYQQQGEARQFEMYKAQTNYAYDLQYGNAYSDDNKTQQKGIETAINSIFEQFGPLIQKSKQWHIDQIQKLIKSGFSLGDAIEMDLKKPITEKPEYQAFMYKSLGLSNDVKYDYQKITQYDEDGNPYDVVGIFQNGQQVSQWGGNSNITLNGQLNLGEKPVEFDLKDYYGKNVKFAPTVGQLVIQANDVMKNSLGYDLKIADSYRSYETQKQAYESGKEGVAKPGYSFHEKGQAFDLNQNDPNMRNPETWTVLRQMGFVQHPGEWRHWSYGEFNSPSKANYTDYEVDDYERYLDNGTLPERIKNSVGKSSPKKLSDFLAGVNEYKNTIQYLPKKDTDNIDKLRNEFVLTKPYKDYWNIKPIFDRAMKGVKEQTLVDDYSLIMSLNKINNPESTVMEGEFQTALKYIEARLPGLAQQAKNRFTGEGIITEEGYKGLERYFTNQYMVYADNYQSTRNNYIDGVNKKYGITNGDEYFYGTERTDILEPYDWFSYEKGLTNTFETIGQDLRNIGQKLGQSFNMFENMPINF